jgi:fructuronate reductase
VTISADVTKPLLLSRAALGAQRGTPVDSAPVRIVHLGLGAFHRAHQAWFTAASDDSAEWGIAAFTGRSATAAEELAPQDGLYTLVVRSDEGDSLSIIPSIVEAVDGADLRRFVQLIEARQTALVTMTITEPGYRLTKDARPDTADAAVRSDIDWLTSALGASELPELGTGGPQTTLGRLLLGLDARRRAGSGPLAIVPCDNIPDNGDFVRGGLIALAELVSVETTAWIRENVSFVSTSVDRITPRTTTDDRRNVAELSGWADRSPVVTEPFSDWVLSGDFPAGRPAWETAGARFVDDIESFERRKLWLLNGAHSLLAYAGLLRGHETVAAAISDESCRAWVEQFWNEAATHLPAEELQLDSYRAALIERFENARIEHRLEQIGMEGVTKLRVRFVVVATAERAAGRDAAGCARAIGAWIALLLRGVRLPDAQSADVARALAGEPEGVAARLLALLDRSLAEDAGFLATVEDAVASFR